eukprot:4883018-Prymnesium_polylepis.2
MGSTPAVCRAEPKRSRRRFARSAHRLRFSPHVSRESTETRYVSRRRPGSRCPAAARAAHTIQL